MCDLISRKELLKIAEQQGHVTVDDILSSQTIEAGTVQHGRWRTHNGETMQNALCVVKIVPSM